MRRLYQQVCKLETKFAKIHYHWVSRDQNEEADELSRIAYREALEETRRERAARVELESDGEGQFLASGKYKVDLRKGTCTCPDFEKWCREIGIHCKHLIAAKNKAE
jgi:ribonuclease HI